VLMKARRNVLREKKFLPFRKHWSETNEKQAQTL
jgi:hypothetical protein